MVNMTSLRLRRYHQVLQLVISMLFLDTSVHSFTLPTFSTRGVTLHRHPPSVIVSPQCSRNKVNAARNILVAQNMISPDQVHDLFVATSIQFSDVSPVSATIGEANAVSTQWLADATATAANGGGGWWQSYINIFKTILSFVHSTIDGPLKAAGIEQTWGISIFLFTALIRSSLLPLSIQQSKSSEYMKALKPYMSEIKVKFKGNDDAINRATGKLIEDSKQNPLAGCFLSLVQIPVFLGLYRGVRLLAMDGQLNEPFLWIPSLEGPVSPPNYSGLDWILKGWTTSSDGGFPFVPQMGWETTLAFLIMPVVLVLLQSTTMKILQPPMDENMTDDEKQQMETTQTVFKFLPLLIGFFSLQVPAGLTIYWFTSNIFTLTQTLGVRAYFAANPPKIELPDYWESALGDGDDMSPEERRKISEAGIRVGPTFEDLVDEAKFHSLIARGPIRNDSLAWQRLLSSSGDTQNLNELPLDLRTWVHSGTERSRTVTHKETPSSPTVQVMSTAATAEASTP